MVKHFVFLLLSIQLVLCVNAQLRPELLHGRLKADKGVYVYGFKNDVDSTWVYINALGEPVDTNEVFFRPDKPGLMKDSAYQLVSGARSEGLFKVQDHKGRYGYADVDGKIVIPCIYKELWSFSEGLAAAMLPGNADYIYIDKEGKTIFSTPFRRAFEFSEGLARVEKRNKFGFINTKGELIIQPSYSFALNFAEGRAVVIKGKQYGFIDRKGNLAIGCQYRHAWSFHEGLAVVTMDDRTYYYIDTLGKKVIDSTYTKAFSFDEGLAPARSKDSFGYINKKAEWVISPRFEDAWGFDGPLALVTLNAGHNFIHGGSSMKYVSHRTFALIDRSGTVKVQWADSPKEDEIFAADYFGPRELPLAPVVVESKPAGANVYFIPVSISEELYLAPY